MSTFALEFGKAKTVAAFLVTELGAVAIFFTDNPRISGYIALATAVLAALAVYVVPNPVLGPPPTATVPDPPVPPGGVA